MKRLTVLMFCAVLALCSVCVSAESSDKAYLGTVDMNGAFELRCTPPEGYQINSSGKSGENGTFLAVISSQDPQKPVMELSIAFDELLADIGRLNDVDDETLGHMEDTFRTDDQVEISYYYTSYGTKLMMVKETKDTVDYVDFFTIYKGYSIEFVLYCAQAPLTDADIQMAIDFLSDVDFVDIPETP